MRITTAKAKADISDLARQVKAAGEYVPHEVPRVRFKKPREGDYGFEFWQKRGGEERLAKLRKAVAQFNNTVSRLNNQYAGLVQVPKPLNVNDEVRWINSAQAYNSRMREIQGILKKNSKTAQDIVARVNPETGEVVYRLRYVDRMLKQAKKKLEGKSLRNQPMIEDMAEQERKATDRMAEKRREFSDSMPQSAWEYAIDKEDEVEWRLKNRPWEQGSGDGSPWYDVDVDAMDADDLEDMWGQLGETTADYARLYLEVWEAFARDFDGYDNVRGIIEDFVRSNPDALEDIFSESDDNPELNIEYMYPSADGGSIGPHRFKQRASADMTPEYKRYFNIEMFWEEKAAEYGIR